MKIFKFILLVLAILLVGGIVMQALGYIDSPLFRWFTDIKLYR